jgi:hypothetical protein
MDAREHVAAPVVRRNLPTVLEQLQPPAPLVREGHQGTPVLQCRPGDLPVRQVTVDLQVEPALDVFPAQIGHPIIMAKNARHRRHCLADL